MIEQGAQAPGFELADQDGRIVRLADYRGKRLVLFFFIPAWTRPVPFAIMATMDRAIGIIRVSQVNGREGESFVSPGEQRDRIISGCEARGLRLLDVYDELDVSGGASLERRDGLRQAVEAVEEGRAEVIVGAYFDRLFRSYSEQQKVVDRVEDAGGRILTVDAGHITNGNASQWLTGGLLGLVSEYHKRVSTERSRAAQVRAIARGAVLWPNIQPGYLRDEDGCLTPDEATRSIVAEAFELRSDGDTIAEVRAFLAENGIKRSYHGVSDMLRSRVYLGEIHFGDSYEPNLSAHPAIVDVDLWNRVQRARVPRGRKAKSDRLLARLGVLRCASCDGRMVVGTQRQNGRVYPFYRCGHVREDCARRVTIGAEIVERLVVETVKAALADAEGRASVEENARDAEVALERAKANLAATIEGFTVAGVGVEPEAVERLRELREVRDRAQERVDHLGGQGPVVRINAAADWDRLSLRARRALIRATVARVAVEPGRGTDRITIELVGE